MANIKRAAHAVWTGNLREGKGEIDRERRAAESPTVFTRGSRTSRAPTRKS